MALKNLFDMVKADKYTADGREELIKAQEAETEDKVYQIGEISQKTGLQKTANGWVKPKSGKQPGAKRETDPQTYIVKKNDELRSMFQKETDPAKKAAMKKALQKQASMMESEPFAPGEEAESKPATQKKSQSVESVKEYLTNNFWSQPEDFKNEMSDAGWDVDEMTNEYAVISNEAGSQYEVRFADHGDGRDLTMKSFKALQIDEDDDSLEDSAPRVLTGDTRIRVRKA